MTRTYGGLTYPRTRRITRVIPPESEADFQSALVNYALLTGWRRIFHPHFSMLSTSGYPDLTMVRVGRDGVARIVFAELKALDGVVSVTQQGWLDDLKKCPGVETYLWSPADWPQIKETLR